MNRRAALALLGLSGLGAAAGGLSVSRAKADNAYYTGAKSDHFDGRLFFNPDGKELSSFIDLMRWQFGGGKAKWPAAWPSPFPQAKPESRLAPDALRVTMVGHASLLIQSGGLNFLTDPVWSPRASPFSFAGPKRVNAPGIAFDDLPPIDYLLVTHNHYDHMDAATLARLKAARDPHVITPLGNDAIMSKAAPGIRISTHDWDERIDVGEGVAVHVEPAHHWSARGTGDRRMALWSAFTIETPAGNVYFGGDTGFHQGRNYELARRKHGGFRLALLPIGAYEPRWFMEPHHQNPEEAVAGFRLLGAEHAAGIHWGTFQLTNEAVDEPRQRLHAALDAEGIVRDRFRAMQPGEVWDVPAAAA
ncbi:MBL fold metallo-hydrolase [Mesorhizobium sp. J428]|uniref:MBL fold metallo-hydrolase n=1 Tax=Mesorhizobium sp. J428 TaxID=2898440 RepID=UPI002150D752|nr:MBL fold metallo-hydrolase [Mesorhizobium sp. J428]MCR5857135.1 MBL fold metallo-hydrolase [Mesorhizobium sp. J428]